MKAETLRKSILQLAIQGKLVKQDLSDEPASILLEKIRAEKNKLIKEGKIKKNKFESFIFKGDDNSHYEKIGKEVKNIESEIPFEIPDNWAWARLNTFSEIRNGFTPLRSNNSLWDRGTIPWFTVSDIRDQGEFIDKTQQFINEISITNDRIVPANSILLCCTASIGEIAYSNIALTTNQQFNGITIKKEYALILSSLYLFNFCKSLKDHLILISGKTTFGFVSVTKLGNILVPIPPLAEQKRIVARIEELKPYIEEYNNLEKQKTALENQFPDKLRKSILQYAIQGKLVAQDPNDEPAEILLERIRKEKELLIKSGKIKKDKSPSYIYKGDDNSYYEKVGNKTTKIDSILLLKIPTSWNWIRFKELVSFNLGKTPPRSENKFWNNGIYPWVSISDMLPNGIIKSTNEKINQHGFNKYFKELSKIGTLLMSFKLTVGRVSYLGIDALHNEAIISIYPFISDNDIIKKYLYEFLPLLSKTGEKKNAIKGSTLNSTSLGNLLIPLPPLSEQQRIIESLQLFYNQINFLK